MCILRKILALFLCTLSINAYSQLSIAVQLGIENPYKYKYTRNVTPKQSGAWGPQEFKFLRTKILKIELKHTFKLKPLKERFSIDVGLGFGGMNQFVADTIANPAANKLLYSVRHVNIFVSPSLLLKYELFEKLRIYTGMDLFIPIRKWIVSEQGSEVFLQDFSENFYITSPYFVTGMEYMFGEINIGLNIQISTKTDHWVEILPGTGAYHEHDLQRWMMYISYEF